jgi:signal transduction histidine kinase/integral membrane sensor domain MASE1
VEDAPPLEAALRPWRSTVVKALVLACAYVAGAKIGLALAFSHPLVTAVWPPTGIAVAALVIWGWRVWPGVLLGALAANALSGAGIETSAGIAMGNTLAPVAAVFLINKLRVRSTFESLRDVVLMTGAAMVAMTISATLGTAVLALAGKDGGYTAWRLWWIGDTMGVLLVTPLLLTTFSRALSSSVFSREWKRSAFLLGAFAVVTVAAVQTGSPIGYLVVPLGLWIAMRLEQEGAAAAALIMSMIDVWHTTAAPRIGSTIEQQLISIQGINATIAIILLSFAAVMQERRKTSEALRISADELEERVRARTEDLRVSEARFAEAQRLARIGSFQWDAATDVNTWSDELYRIYDRDPKSGPPGMEEYLSFVRPDAVIDVRTDVDIAIATGQAIGHEYPVILKDGTEKWVHAYVEVIKNADGTLAGLRGTCQDITERKASEDVLRSALERERQAAEDLRKLDQAKNAFLSAVSHELRTPLTAIIGFTELLGEPAVREDQEMVTGLVERLGFSSNRLSDLLSDLLDIDRLHRGILEPHRRRAVLRDLVERALVSVNLGKHPLSVEIDDAEVLVDAAQVERIVENLVSNAVKYTPAGTEITVVAHARSDDGLTLTVQDRGPGVPADLRETVFEPFVRGDTGTFTPGTGIGLALVDSFAKLHGGRAWIDESDGGGARFHVELPGPADERQKEVEPAVA